MDAPLDETQGNFEVHTPCLDSVNFRVMAFNSYKLQWMKQYTYIRGFSSKMQIISKLKLVCDWDHCSEKEFKGLLSIVHPRWSWVRQPFKIFGLGVLFSSLTNLYADFQEKIFPETSWKKLQTFHGSNVLLPWKVWNFFPDVSGNIFLKIGILKAKIYIKNVPNREVCDFIPAPSRTSSIKQVIVVLY